MCHTHKNKLNKEMNRIADGVDEEMRTEAGDNDQEMATISDDADYQNDYIPPDTLSDENNDEKQLALGKQVKKAVKQLAKTLGISRLFSQKPFAKLQEETQKKKVRVVKTIHNAIYECVSDPHSSVDLRNAVELKFDRHQTKAEKYLEGLMERVVDNYYDAPNAMARRAVLSLISPIVAFSEAKSKIPQLNYREYWRSKFIDNISRQIQQEEKLPQKLRVSFEAIYNFVQFITAPELIIDLPFGSETLKLKSGEEIEVPKVIRRQAQTELIRLYNSSIALSGENQLKLSTSTCVRILDVLPTKSSISLQCVDYFISDGEKDFFF